MIKKFIEQIKSYFESYIELYKIRGIKKGVNVASWVSFRLLLLFFLVLSIPFMGVALALFFGELFSSYALGFLCVGGLFLLLFLIFIAFRKSIIRSFKDAYTKILMSE